MPLASIPDAAADIRERRMIIIVDDEDRENEGDLVCAVELVTPKKINFMARDTVASVPRQASSSGELSGRQRRHGR